MGPAVIQQSSVIKYAGQGVDITGASLKKSHGPDTLLRQNLVLVLSNLLAVGYSIAYMLGTQSALHPNGFPALLCVLLLATGSLLAAGCYAAVALTRSRQCGMAMAPEKKLPILLGLGAGFCHYGGTVLQMYSLPLLSAPVSALLTKTSSLWTYMWGILYGEYRGSPARAKGWLAAGILLFVLGIVLLTNTLYK